MLLTIAQQFREWLVPLLIVGTAILLAMLAVLIGQRLLRAALATRQRTLEERHRPAIERALAEASPEALAAVAAIPRRHRRVASTLLLATLRVIRGAPVERARAIAAQLGLLAGWHEDLESRFWWHKSEAALALGLLRDRDAVPAVTRLLDDDHEQVRAAAIDALGQIGDPAAIAPLLTRMDEPTRHEHARVVQALRGFGQAATRALVEHGRSPRAGSRGGGDAAVVRRRHRGERRAARLVGVRRCRDARRGVVGAGHDWPRRARVLPRASRH